MSKIKKLLHLIKHPYSIKRFLIAKYGQKLSFFFVDSPFFLQGQMDMHPLSNWFKPDSPHDFIDRPIKNLEPWDTTRRDMLTLLLQTIIKNDIQGDFAELGVYKGSTARLIHHFAPERHLHLFDTFEGFKDRNASEEMNQTGLTIEASQFSDTSVDIVRSAISPRNDNVHFYKGYFPESIPDTVKELTFAFAHLDADLYIPTWEGLTFFYAHMKPRSIIVVHDYNSWPGARKAVDEFFKNKPEMPIPMPDKSGSVLIIKQ